jgi:hypothetical protein
MGFWSGLAGFALELAGMAAIKKLENVRDKRILSGKRPKVNNVDQRVREGKVVERLFKDGSDFGYWDKETGEFLGSRRGGERRGYATWKEDYNTLKKKKR